MDRASEISRMNAPSSQQQHRQDMPLAASDLYRGAFHNQAGEDDDMAASHLLTTEEADLEATDLGARGTAMTRQVPQSHVELEKINLQLAEEYKYVENLRRDLR